jgi:hypothetical protein
VLNLRLIKALGAPVLMSLLLVGCGGGAGTTANPTTANEVGSTTTTTPSTGSATVSWVAPIENSNGTALTNLAGFRIYYGTDSAVLNQVVDVDNAQATSYQVTGLTTGTWYFAVTSITTSGVESAHSTVGSKTI